jgi:transposase
MKDSIIRYCVGIDVDKKTFKTCCVGLQYSGQVIVKATKTFNNSEEGFKELLQWKQKQVKEIDIASSFVMEATGVYHEHLAYFLHEKKQTVHVVLANKAKRYIQSLGIRTKNDKIDAQGLATMGVQQFLDIWKPISEQLYSLRSITRQIEALQCSKTAFSNQLEAATHSPFSDKLVIKNLKSIIKTLDKNITSFQKKVEKIVTQDAELDAKFKLYKNLKGFGIMTFAVIVAETGGFELFKSQGQLVNYAGYDIVENASGKRIGKTKISKKGNNHIRRIMHMSSLNMVKHKIPIFTNLQTRIYERTKIKMKGYVAIQRKLLCLVYIIWKTNKEFDLNYQENKNISLEKKPKSSFGSGLQDLKKKAVLNETVLH